MQWIFQNHPLFLFSFIFLFTFLCLFSSRNYYEKFGGIIVQRNQWLIDIWDKEYVQAKELENIPAQCHSVKALWPETILYDCLVKPF